MSGFPKLIPAFTVSIDITPPNQFGVTATGNGLDMVSFIPDVGGIKSEPGYPIQVDATWVHGSDYIKADPDHKHVRLDVVSTAKDKKTGALIRYNYTGTIDMSGGAGKVLSGQPGAGTTDFGEIFAHVKIETGSPELVALQNKTYVASGRFIVQEGKPLTVEYKVSEVSA